MNNNFDVVVIGGGVAGYVSAIRLAQLSKKVCLIEKDKIGGICLNEGCIPTKAIIHSVNVIKTMNRSRDFGIICEKPNIDFISLMKRKDAIVKKLVDGIEFLLKKRGIEVIFGEAIIKEPSLVKVNNIEIKTKTILICVGSQPILPFEIDKKNIVSSKETLDWTELPKSVLVIGGGAIGIEFANIFSKMGSKVIIVEMLKSILPEVKDEKIIKIIKRNLESDGVKIIEGIKVEGLKFEKDKGVQTFLSSGEEIFTEKVILACGRIPNGDEFKKLGINIDNHKIMVNEKMQTNIEGIYAAGDVVGPPLFAYKAMAEGIVAAENICGFNKKMKYNAVPMCIFSSPELACVGKFENEVPDAIIGEYPFKGIGKALCIGEEEGFVKVVCDKFNKVKGVQIVGHNATELIPIGIIAVEKELHSEEIGNLIFPHPTLSECIKEAFLDITSSAIHKIK